MIRLFAAISVCFCLGCSNPPPSEEPTPDAEVITGGGIATVDVVAELVGAPDTGTADGDVSGPEAETTPQPDGDPPSDDGGDDDSVTQTDGVGATCDEGDLGELYTKYVEPFVSGAVAQSCSQCHMTGVDISMYAQDTPCDTMACMVNLDAVDLDEPAASAILEHILMGSPNSSVFDVQEEYDAMLEWIQWSSLCHGAVCGEISDACNVGTGAESTGMTPLGDCSEDDLLAVFWDAVIIDRGRCVTCHSTYAAEIGKFGPCDTEDDCWGPQLCIDNICHSPYPLTAPHFFEGGCTGSGSGKNCKLVWNNSDHKQIGLNTMYNVLALGLIDTDAPLDSSLLVKPLLEDFQPLAVYGPGVSIPSVPEGVGAGIYHGGTSKIAFGCHEPPCPMEGIIDCRKDTACSHDYECGDGQKCLGNPGKKFCRIPDSLCDDMYVNMVRFVEYYAACDAD